VIELAQRNLVTIYCISTQAFGFANASDDNLVRLATETGGRVVYPLGDVYKDTDGYLSNFFFPTAISSESATSCGCALKPFSCASLRS